MRLAIIAAIAVWTAAAPSSPAAADPPNGMAATFYSTAPLGGSPAPVGRRARRHAAMRPQAAPPVAPVAPPVRRAPVRVVVVPYPGPARTTVIYQMSDATFARLQALKKANVAAPPCRSRSAPAGRNCKS